MAIPPNNPNNPYNLRPAASVNREINDQQAGRPVQGAVQYIPRVVQRALMPLGSVRRIAQIIDAGIHIAVSYELLHAMSVYAITSNLLTLDMNPANTPAKVAILLELHEHIVKCDNLVRKVNINNPNICLIVQINVLHALAKGFFATCIIAYPGLMWRQNTCKSFQKLHEEID